MLLRRAAAALILASALLPTSAHAQVDPKKGSARELTVEGYALLDKKDYAAAVDRFERAEALFHAPTILLGLARAYVGLGKLASAHEMYNRVAHETVAPDASEAFVNAVNDAKRELAALAPRVPGLLITIKGPSDPKVTVDGVDVPRAALGVKWPVDPGQHVVKVTAAGFLPREASVTAAEGKASPVNLALEVDPNDRPPSAEVPFWSGRRIAGAAVGGVGIAGAIVGAITCGLTLAKASSAKSHCKVSGETTACDPTGLSLRSDARTLANVSNVALVAGGAALAAGVIVFATAPSTSKPASGLWIHAGPTVGAAGYGFSIEGAW
ncbi:MAG: tetratricopeptide repeat protein [Myxococcota bacterium]